MTDGLSVFRQTVSACSKPATYEHLAKVQLELNGYALRWKELEEDLTIPELSLVNFS
jgi:hypothetical protein